MSKKDFWRISRIGDFEKFRGNKLSRIEDFEKFRGVNFRR